MGMSCGRDFSLSSAETLETLSPQSAVEEGFEMLRVVHVCFVLPGEHDIRPGRERHAGGEGRQEGVHRLANQDADH